MSLKNNAFKYAVRVLRGAIRFLGDHRGAKASAHLVEQLTPIISIETKAGTLRFYCPGKLPLWRAETLLTKEPETIEWIDTFKEGDVLWDIGANVGIYSLYAAQRSDVRVLAFEPAVVNCFVLNRNIEINRFDEKVSSYCLAFSDTTSLGSFYMSDTDSGGALHSFGKAIDWQGKPLNVRFKQGMTGYSIDDFVRIFSPPFPSHIKIDVDGIEGEIIRGAQETLCDERLRSLLVELDTARTDYRIVCEALEQSGWVLDARRHAAVFDTGRFSSVYNHIFVRP